MKRISNTDMRELNLLIDEDYIVIQERQSGILSTATRKYGRRHWTDTRIAMTVDELRKILAKVEAGAGK